MDIKINKKEIIKIINSVIDKDLPLISNLANISRVLYEGFENVSWAGFYLTLRDEQLLYLGPYQGPLACTMIPFTKGVCGEAASSKKTILVDDVHKFKGHIACSSLTNSELVSPIIKDNKVLGVIDLDSNNLGNFTNDDAKLLEEIAIIISNLF